MGGLYQYLHKIFNLFRSKFNSTEWKHDEFCINENTITPEIQNNIIGSTFIILDHDHHMFVHYDDKITTWELPSGPTDYHILADHERLMLILSDQYGVSISNIRYWCIRKYTNHTMNPFKRIHTKYVIIYLADLNNNLLHYEKYRFKNAMATYSQITELPLYNEYKPIIDIYYEPYKIQLIMDIDRTLLISHTNVNYFLTKNYHPDCMVDYDEDTNDIITDKQIQTAYIWVRPYMYCFLNQMAKLTHLSYWTAASAVFQSKVIKCTKIDQYSKYIHYIDKCSYHKESDIFYKSITNLNNNPSCDSPYDMNRVLLVDDWIHNVKQNLNNALLVPSWDIECVDTYRKLYFYKGDLILNQLKSYIQYLSDKVIHEYMTIPELLSHPQRPFRIPE